MIAVTVSNNNANDNALETIDAISKAGFQKVFLEWYNKDYPISQEKQFDYCKEKGLEILFFHLGYSGINHLWLEGEAGDQLVLNYKKDFEICKEKGIDKVCMHICSKANPPSVSDIGLKRLKDLIDYAKELNIQIAFENTKSRIHLETVLNTFKDAHVGMCLDAGHLHAHFNDEFDYELVKDRIFLVHLHDNHGEDDEHLLPFDGTMNWDWLLLKLQELNYQGELIFELVYRHDYLKMTIDEFYTKGYKLAKTLESQRKALGGTV